MKSFKRRDGYYVATIDFLTNFVVVLLAISIFAAVQHKGKTSPPPMQGRLVVTLHWQKTSDSDVDLWVRGPAGKPVGFSHMTGQDCNLVRDDLGRSMDPASQNREETICRKATPGLWIVNAFEYRAYDGQFPIQARLSVWLADAKGSWKRVLSRSLTMTEPGQELTAFQFRLDAKGHFLPAAVNHIQHALYNNGMSAP